MARKRTLLLIFIHGFKGGDDTFGSFPEHLQQILQGFLPNVTVKSVVYPRYETRGDLPSSVALFRSWLQDVVIDAEYLNDNPSGMVDPSVRVVLLAHSMGGIVAADTLLSILDDKPIKKIRKSSSSPSSPKQSSLDPRKNKNVSKEPLDELLDDEHILFPCIIGICAFDTPYLGLAASMFAHSAESNFRTASNAYSTVSNIVKTVGILQDTTGAATAATSSTGGPAAALPSAAAAASSQGGGWGWGKIAMWAGAAATVSAGATAAYWNRTEITQGFAWVTSHFEFVGVLFKPEELKARILRASSVPGVGIANFYTVLGSGAKQPVTPGGKQLEVGGGGLRTFCSLPPKPTGPGTPSSPLSSSQTPSSPSSKVGTTSTDQRGAADIDVGDRDMRDWWYPSRNDKATDEVNAHMYMFSAQTNPAYRELREGTSKQIMKWTINWYDSGT